MYINDTLIIVKDFLNNDPVLQTNTNIPAEDLLDINRITVNQNLFSVLREICKANQLCSGGRSSILNDI